MSRRLPIVLLGLVPAAVSMLAALPQTVCCGDVNGDWRTNVLDAQGLVAAVLHVRGSRRLQSDSEDVNGDGVVDILDLQRLLSETGDTGPRSERYPHTGGEDDVSVPGRVQPPVFRLAEVPHWPWQGACGPETNSSALEPGAWRVAAARERYLFTLTPNAPPAANSILASISITENYL